MTDVYNKATRSYNMSHIKGKTQTSKYHGRTYASSPLPGGQASQV